MIRVFLRAAIFCFILALPAAAESFQTSTIQLPVYYPTGFYVDVGQTQTVYLPRRLFLHKLILQVESFGGYSGGEVLVNGDKKGNFFVTPTDPSFTVTVEAETSSVQITGVPAANWPQGRLVVRGVQAVVSETDFPGSVGQPGNSSACDACSHLPFPIYYRTVMGNVANRAIILSDRLMTFANYEELGRYLLPVKKAAAAARSIAEARGDASQVARPYYVELLRTLDAAEPYLRETFERSQAFELATELMTLREYIRDILD